MIKEAKFNDTLLFLILRERERLKIGGSYKVYLCLRFVGFLRRNDMTDSLKVWWKLPELSDRLTMLEIVGTRSAEHSSRSQLGIGSDLHCLLEQLNKISEISDSEASLKVEKSGDVMGNKVNVEILR